MMKCLLILLLSLLFAVNVVGQQQEPVSFQFSQNSELKDIYIYDILEGKNGFIWLAGRKGLYRYDGREFKKYKNLAQKGLSIFGLSEDDDENIWCSNINGQVFQVKNDSLYARYSIPKEFQAKEQLYVVHEFNNQLYVLGDSFLGSIDRTNHRKVQYLDDFYPTSVLREKDTLFFGGNHPNVYSGFHIYYVTKNNKVPQLYHRIIHPKEEIQIGSLYSHKNQLHVIYRNQESAIQKVSPNSVTSLLEDINLDSKITTISSINDSVKWISTYKGAHLIHPNQEKIQESIYQDVPVSKLLKDQCDNLWVTTLGRGVFVLPNYRLKKTVLRNDYGRITAGTMIHKNRLVFGTDSGYLIFYNAENQSIEETISIGSSQRVENIFYDAKRNVLLLFGDTKHSLVYDLKRKKIDASKIVQFNSIKSVTQISDDELFLGHYRKQIIFNLENLKPTHQTFPMGRTYASHYDSLKKNLYISYLSGTKKVDTANQVVPIQIAEKQNQSLVASQFTQLQNGDIYVGTFKHGIFKLVEDQFVQQFSEKNGLLSNEITAIASEQNFLWVATESSIQKIDLNTKQIQTISHLDGVESFKVTSLFVLDEKIVFTTNLGLFSFDKDEVFKPMCKKEPYFTAVSIAGEQMPIQSFYRIKPSQNNIQLQFNTSGFKNNQTYSYAYKLKGLQKEWQPLSKGVQEVQFNSLPQGKYQFLLKITNYEHEAITEPIDIIVEEYLYKQWWFLLLIGVFLMSAIIAYYSNVLKRQKIEQQIVLEQQSYETEKIALKLENLRSQMNPHFVFNALNSIQDYILNNQKNLAGDYLGKFAQLIRLYLEQSQKKVISLEEEIDTLNRYLELEQLRFEDLLEYSIQYENLAIAKEYIPTMLIQPYVENAIKHGFLHKKEKGILSIHFKMDRDKNCIICEIEDNGIGREQAKEIQEKQKRYQSFSTKAITDRVQLLNRQQDKENQIGVEIMDLYKNHQSRGTKVILIMPRLNQQ